MNIAVNLLPFREHLAGAGRYAQNIISELSKIDDNNNYFLFVTPNNQKNFIIKKKNFEIVECNLNSGNLYKRIFWEQFVFPSELKARKIDILFTPSVAIPLFYSGSMFTTIHDIAFKRVKHKYPFLRRLYVAFITRKAFAKSELVFTVSNFSKSELETIYPGRKKEIVVTYNGVNEIYFSELNANKAASFKKKYSLDDNFFLYVGAIEPGKNIETIFKSFAGYKKESGRKISLVMTGGIGWKKEEVLKIIGQYGLQDSVKILPYIEEDELPLLYKMAELVLYISTYEGFGLPVLEAMASGVPVIASYSHAVKEFAENAAVLVDPYDINLIKNKMSEISSDLNFKNNLVEKGIAVAKNFTWEKSASIVYSSFMKKNYIDGK